MFSSLMNIGVSGLSAAQAALATTSHNIANANVQGYSRQQVVLSTASAQSAGAGFYGRGVAVTTVMRHYDQFLAQSVQGLTSVSAADRARAEALTELDSIFGDPQAGVGAAIDFLFGAIGDVANRPGDVAARQVLLSTLQQTAQRFNTVGAQLHELAAQANARLGYEASQVNERLTQLNQLNQQIAQSSSSGRPPNDLLDQRDVALQALGGLISIRTVAAENGALSIFTAGGLPLLVGQQQSVLEATADPADVSATALRLRVGSTDTWLGESALGGGSLAGLLRFRDTDLATVQAHLGRLATVLSSSLNAQQTLGVDAQGNPGQPLLSLPDPVVRPHAGNAGSGELAVQVVDPSRMAAGSYRVQWDGANYSVTRLPDQRVTSGLTLPQVIDGLEFTATGAAEPGDSWMVKPYEQAATGLRAAVLSPAQLATGYGTVARADLANTGTARVASHEVVRASPDSATPVRITFNDPPTSFNVTGLAGGDLQDVPFVPGQSIPPSPGDYNGWRLVLEGRPNPGDAFEVVPNPSPGTDNRNALALGRLATQGLVQGSTLNEGYAQLIADAGSRVKTVRDLAEVSGRMRLEAQSRRENLSGVNLDEEAANLLRHQQSYQACAKIIQTSQSLFETMLAAAGR